VQLYLPIKNLKENNEGCKKHGQGRQTKISTSQDPTAKSLLSLKKRIEKASKWRTWWLIPMNSSY
jgi:hypothetical protein